MITVLTMKIFRGEQSEHRINFVPGALRGETPLSKSGAEKI